ncbi:MAG: SCP2 sterol-binding domain-containing protein [Myxococcaceae bacterium]
MAVSSPACAGFSAAGNTASYLPAPDDLEEIEPACVVRAPYSVWKQMLLGTLDPVQTLMQGRVRVQGDAQQLIARAPSRNCGALVCGDGNAVRRRSGWCAMSLGNEMKARATKLTGRAMQRLLADEHRAAQFAEFVCALQKGKQLLEQRQNDFLRSMGIASREDYKAVSNRLAGLKRRARELSEKLDELTAAGVGAGTPTKRRKRR